MNPSSAGPSKQRNHRKDAVRHAEKRRTGTCEFADRVAAVSLECYRKHIPSTFREVQKQTCVATIVAHFEGHLKVQSLGVGTKFLKEDLLKRERENDVSNFIGLDGHTNYRGYGCRVRDCHAEVLARRAFCRKLYSDIRKLRLGKERCRSNQDFNLLELCEGSNRVRLKDNVTLHLYSSSAPCGNATLKKFSTMKKESFDDTLGANDWPCSEHQPIPHHSIHLGQFSLLLKKDHNAIFSSKSAVDCSPKIKSFPANDNDDWCPPGTTTVFSNQGSIHTCSDKICRWNHLGIQGSLLASLFETPLYIKSLTVGRKFTSSICQRAFCCRAVGKKRKINHQRKANSNTTSRILPSFITEAADSNRYILHHPSIMGTGVYMDNTGVLEMDNQSEIGQDVRFNSPLCWVWWLDIDDDCKNFDNTRECINGDTGLAISDIDPSSKSDYRQGDKVSRVSTISLVNQYCEMIGMEPPKFWDVESIRSLKETVSAKHEAEKFTLLTRNHLFRHWRRR